MTPNDYQRLAARTLLEKPNDQYTPQEIMVVWDALGLAGEAGETADYLKKVVFHRHQIDLERLKKELGDVLWYVAALCTNYGLSLEDVMAANVHKLEARYPAGFCVLASQRRSD